ncbi:hypothetical protein Tco_0969728 [Tanacetum coccineum]
MMIWGLAAMVKCIDCKLFGNDDKHMMSYHSAVFDKPWYNKAKHVVIATGIHVEGVATADDVSVHTPCEDAGMGQFRAAKNTTGSCPHVNHDG